MDIDQRAKITLYCYREMRKLSKGHSYSGYVNRLYRKGFYGHNERDYFEKFEFTGKHKIFQRLLLAISKHRRNYNISRALGKEWESLAYNEFSTNANTEIRAIETQFNRYTIPARLDQQYVTPFTNPNSIETKTIEFKNYELIILHKNIKQHMKIAYLEDTNTLYIAGDKHEYKPRMEFKHGY